MKNRADELEDHHLPLYLTNVEFFSNDVFLHKLAFLEVHLEFLYATASLHNTACDSSGSQQMAKAAFGTQIVGALQRDQRKVVS